MAERRVTCPTGCGSTTFRAHRLAAIVEDFTVEDDGTVVEGSKFAEGGGKLSVSCSECGHTWTSRRGSLSSLATFVESY